MLRKSSLFDHLAPSGSGPNPGVCALAILGFHGPRDFSEERADRAGKNGSTSATPSTVDDLMERHRHNLPEWLVKPLKGPAGRRFWPLVESLAQSAPLDLRVNAPEEKAGRRAEGAGSAGIYQIHNPYSPWGLRIDKPALTKLDAFTAGAIEVQDEGSQLLALAAGRQTRRDGGGFCAPVPGQNPGHWRHHAQHRAVVRV